MDYFKINGKSYDVVVTGIKENFEILYTNNTGRTLSDGAPITLDPIGTFYSHQVTVKRKKGYEKEFDDLFNLISKPIRVVSEDDGFLVEAAHGQKTIAYRAYISKGGRDLVKIDRETRVIHWGELSMNIIPIKAQVIPT